MSSISRRRKLLAVSRSRHGCPVVEHLPRRQARSLPSKNTYPNFGSLVVRDLRTGKAVVELEGLCTCDGYSAADSAPSGSRPAGARPIRSSRSRSGRSTIRWSPDGTDDRRRSMAPAPASSRSGTPSAAGCSAPCRMIPSLEAQEPDLHPGLEGTRRVASVTATVQLVSTETWTVTSADVARSSLQGDDSLRFVGYHTRCVLAFSPVGGFLGGEGGAIHWLDPQTLTVQPALDE